MDRHHLDLPLSNPIDNTVAAEKDLPDAFNLQFWHNPPHERVLHQTVSSTEGTISKHSRNLWSVASDKEADRLKIIESL